MVKRSFFTFIVFLVCSVLKADPPFSSNVEVSSDPWSSNQNETGLAVDYPFVYCNWNDSRSGNWHIGFSRSENGGDYFLDDTLIMDNFYSDDGDPVLQVGEDGTLYQLWLSFSSTTYYGRLVLMKSYDHGVTWVDTVFPSGFSGTGHLPDKPWFRVKGDTVYIVYADFNTWTWYGQVKFTRSLDGGASFEPPISVSGAPSDIGLPFIAVDPAGKVYVIWMDTDSYQFKMAVSTNGGESFTQPTVVHSVQFTSNSNWRAHPIPSLETGGPDTLYLTWLDDRFGSWDILFSKSTDGGVTWSNPIKVNDDTGYGLQMMPMLSVDSSGIIHIAFYDRRTGLWEIRYARSTNRGLSFEPNIRVSDQSFYGNYFMGDYMGIASDNSYVYVVWSDGREGDQDIYFARGEGLVGALCGDANGDGAIGPDDIVYIGNFLFWGGPQPVSPLDPNGDGVWDNLDILYLANFLYWGGPAPCEG